jgi:MFS family permease
VHAFAPPFDLSETRRAGNLASVFFFAFAAMQLRLGVALDRYGPRRCMLAGSGIVLMGCAAFSTAASLSGLIAGRVLLGIGSSCFLMAPLALYARRFAADRFSALAGIQIGLGTLGAAFATAPLAFAAAAIGWRMSFVWVGVVMLTVAIAIAVIVRERETAATASGETLAQSLAGIRAALRTPAIGRLFLMHIATYSSFVYIAGLWGGPYLTHVYGYGLKTRGDLLLIAALAQALGMMAWGAAVRLFGGHKRPVLIGAGLTIAALAFLVAGGKLAPAVLAIWLALFGACAAYTPVVIAHGKSLFPPHLVGCGITLLNIGTTGGVFATQIVSGLVIDLFPAEAGVYPLIAYQVAFAMQAGLLLLACLVYLPARDPQGADGLASAATRRPKVLRITSTTLAFCAARWHIVAARQCDLSHSRRPPWAFPP